jgi:hypothetical protein
MEGTMDTRSFLRRATNVLGVFMALGALALIVDFMLHLWGAYHGQPAASSRFGG